MIENPYGLRAAGPADAEALLQFILPIYGEDAAQPVSTAKLAELVARCVNRDNALAGIVSGPGGIEASVGAVIDRFDYTEDVHIMVKWLGVGSAYRRTDLAARLIGYVRWLYDTMQPIHDTPVPVFIPTLTTLEHQRKVRLYQRKAPQVGTLFAFGCLPDRSFVTTRAGKGTSGGKEARKVPTLVRRSEPLVRAQ